MGKSLKNAILSLALLGTTLALPARAEEPEKQPTTPASSVQLFADASYRSIYDANGGTFFSEGPVMQQIVTACAENTCLTIWNNYDLEQRKDNEVDLTLDYTHTLPNGNKIKAGYMDVELFLNDGNHSNTQEAFLAFITENGLDLRLCRHLNQSSGIVLKGTLSKQIGPFATAVTLGHNHHYWTFDQEGNDGQGNYVAGSVSMPIKIGEKFVLSPTASCQRATGTLENKCWGSIGITYAK